MSNRFTTTYVQDRIQAMLPQPVHIDRTGTTDVDDLLDSVKERIARVLNQDQDAAYYLVLLTVQACAQNVATMQTSLAAIDKYAVALRTPSNQVRAVTTIDCSAVTGTAQASAVAALQKELLKTATTANGLNGLTLDTAVAQTLFDQACTSYTTAWQAVQQQIGGIKDFVTNFAKTDLTQHVVNRQARQLQTVLDSHYASEQPLSTAAAVDMLIGAQLLNHVGAKIDITRNKFTGTTATPTAHTLILPLETIKTYWVRHGDRVYSNHASVVFRGSVTSILGQAVTTDATNLALYTEFIVQSLGAYSYTVLQPLLNNMDLSSFTDVVSKAVLFSSTGAQSTQFHQAITAATAACTLLASYLAGYTAGRVTSLVDLITALREEALIPVIDKLLLLDLTSIRDLTVQDFSTHDTLLSLLGEVSDILSMGDATADITEAPSTLASYMVR